MKIKIIIQFLMVLFIIMISWAIFLIYFKKDVSDKILDNSIKKEIISKNNNSNYIENNPLYQVIILS